MLSPYRVLDLSTNHSAVCGAMLADLGADVIAVEPLSGSPLRQEGPFRHDEPDAEHSLTWWSYSRNKRSVSLDITSAAGRAALLNLVDGADFRILWQAPRAGVLAASPAPRFGQTGRVRIVLADGSALAVVLGMAFAGRAKRFLAALRPIAGELR